MADFEVTGEASLGPDHLIEDVTAIIDKLDELATKIDELDRKLTDLSHKDVSIGVIIDGQDKLDELKLFLDELDSHDYTVKIKVDILDKDKLDALYLDILELELTDHTVDVKVQTDGIAAADAKIAALNRTLDDNSKKLDKSKDSANKFAFSLMMLAPLAIPAASAIVSLVGAAGGLAAAFGAMAVPALAFGYSLKSTFTAASTLVSGLTAVQQASLSSATSFGQVTAILDKSSKSYQNMNSYMRNVVTEYVLLKNALNQFQQAVQPQVAVALGNLFTIMEVALTYLTPAVQQFGNAFNDVLGNLLSKLQAPTFQKFFKDATTWMGALVFSWGDGFLNIIEGITALLDAFLPLGVQMSAGFLRMTKDFDNWAQHLAQSEGFKKFINLVETDGPILLNILGQVVGIVIKLVGALAMSSGNTGFLQFLDNMLKTLNKFLGTHQGLATTAADLLLIGLAASKFAPLIGPLLAFLGTPVGLVVGVIVALGAAFIYAYTHSKAFHDWVNTNLKPMWDKLVHDVTQFKDTMVQLWPDIKKAWDRFVPQLTLIVKGFVEGMTSMWSGLIQIIMGLVQFFTGLLTGKWSLIWKGLGNIFMGFFLGMGGMMQGLLTMILGVFEAIGKFVWGLIGKYVTMWVAKFVTFIAQTLSNFAAFGTNLYNQIQSAMARFSVAVLNGILGVVNWFTRLPGNIVHALGNLGSVLWNAGVQLLEGFIGGILSMFSSVASTLGNLTSLLTSWKGPPSKDKTLLHNSGQLVIQGFIDGLESKYGAVANSLGGLTKSVGGQFGSQFTTDISAKLNASLNSKLGNTSVGTGGNMSGGVAQSVSFGAVTINNPSPETGSQSLTKMLQSTAAFGIVQAPMGASFPGRR